MNALLPADRLDLLATLLRDRRADHARICEDARALVERLVAEELLAEEGVQAALRDLGEELTVQLCRGRTVPVQAAATGALKALERAFEQYEGMIPFEGYY